VYLFVGEESYLIDRAVQRVLSAIVPDQLAELNTQVFDAEETLPVHVVTACNTLPFMAERRVVLLKNAHAYGKAEQQRLISYVMAPSPTTTLLITGQKPSQALQQAAKDALYRCRRPSERSLPHWIHTMARDFGKEVTPGATEHLILMVGPDLQALHNELAKLALYAGANKRTIDESDVTQVTSDVKVTTVFELTKAIGEKDLTRTLYSLDRIWESGESYLKVMGMIARQFRHLIMTKDILETDGTQVNLRDGLGISNPHYIRELVSQAQRFSRHALETAVVSLWKTDIQLKSSPLSKRLLLEDLVIRLCRGKATT
jgi:DNA polymerase-3 subunit delta